MSVHLVTDDQTLEREAEAGLEERERSGLLDRRSAWSDPRTITAVVQLLFSGCSIFVAVIGLAVVVLGGAVGSYVLMQTKDATSEVSNQQLVTEMQKISTKLDVVADDVKELSNAKTEQGAKIEALDKAISQNETQTSIVASKVSVAENKIAKLEAQVSK